MLPDIFSERAAEKIMKMHVDLISKTFPLVFLVLAFGQCTYLCKFPSLLGKHKVDILGCMTNFTTRENCKNHGFKPVFIEALFTEYGHAPLRCANYSSDDRWNFHGEFTLFYKLSKNICEANQKLPDYHTKCDFGLKGQHCMDCATNINWTGEFTSYAESMRTMHFTFDFFGPSCTNFTGFTIL